MATANFGKIQIGIYVEIKRSDGEPRRRSYRPGPAFGCSWRGRGAGRLIDCLAGLWGREGGGRGAFVCGVCASEAGVGSAPGAAAVRGAGRGPLAMAWVSRQHLWGVRVGEAVGPGTGVPALPTISILPGDSGLL